MPDWRLLAAGAALMAYALVSFFAMAWAPAHSASVAWLFGPLLAALAVGGAVRRHLPTLLGCAALALLLGLLVARGAGQDLNRLYVLQHAAMLGSLGATFAFTLRRGATPLITRMAQRMHSQMTPAMRDYTGWLTRAWALFFAAMIAVSLVLYALAPWPWWSFFGNVLTPLAAAAFFVGEHLLRYRRHPEFERVTLAQAVRAFRTVTGS